MKPHSSALQIVVALVALIPIIIFWQQLGQAMGNDLLALIVLIAVGGVSVGLGLALRSVIRGNATNTFNALPQSKQQPEKDWAKGLLRVILVGSLTGAFLICIIITGFTWYLAPILFNTAKPRAGDSPLNYLIINQGDWKCYPDNSGSIVFEGNVQNTGPYNIWNIVVGVALVDNAGVETSSNAGYADRVVGPNSKARFDVATYNEDPSKSYTCRVKVIRSAFK